MGGNSVLTPSVVTPADTTVSNVSEPESNTDSRTESTVSAPEPNGGETIKEPDVPLSDADKTTDVKDGGRGWSLIDLVIMILAVALFTELAVRAFKKKLNSGFYAVISVILAAAAVIIFFLTSDFSGKMNIFSNVTVYMLLIAAIQIIVAFVSRKDSDGKTKNTANI